MHGSATSALQLTSQPQSVTALWALSSYTAWWTEAQLVQGYYLAVLRAPSRFGDLLAYYRYTTKPCGILWDIWNLGVCEVYISLSVAAVKMLLQVHWTRWLSVSWMFDLSFGQNWQIRRQARFCQLSTAWRKPTEPSERDCLLHTQGDGGTSISKYVTRTTSDLLKYSLGFVCSFCVVVGIYFHAFVNIYADFFMTQFYRCI